MIKFEKAYYIKLGEGGKWENDSIKSGKIRLGWVNVPIELIQSNNWDKIRQLVNDDFSQRGKRNGSTNDYNALKNICDSNESTVFVTFSNGKMYWTTAKSNSINEDSESKYLLTSIPWSDQDIEKFKTFEINQISGRITKYQLYMGTCCKIGNAIGEFDYLKQIINKQESEDYIKLISSLDLLKDSLIKPIQTLIPKDFEILIDLIFRNNGWRRTSVLGEVMKFFDLVLEEPFTNKLFGVQIKSSCGLTDFKTYAEKFEGDYSNDFETLYFIVHSLRNKEKMIECAKQYEKTKLLTVEDIADLVINAGLVKWVMDKIK